MDLAIVLSFELIEKPVGEDRLGSTKNCSHIGRGKNIYPTPLGTPRLSANKRKWPPF